MKGSYAPLYKLPPDHGWKAALLQQVRQLLQPQALLPAARQSEGCQDLFAVRIKGFEHATAQSVAAIPSVCFPVWSRAWISFLGGSWDLSRFLHPQALYRPKRSFAAHVHGFSTRSSFTRLDDAAQGTARIVRWRWKTDFQKEAQRRITQALKKEERCFVKANAEPDWVGSRISGMFGNSHGHWSI
jgi:hypothetical protein